MTASLGDKFAEAAIIRQRFESTCEPVHSRKFALMTFFAICPRSSTHQALTALGIHRPQAAALSGTQSKSREFFGA